MIKASVMKELNKKSHYYGRVKYYFKIITNLFYDMAYFMAVLNLVKAVV